MEDFIERSKAIGVLNKLAKDNFTVRDVFSFYIGALHDAADGIKQLPSVDAVEVVRCKDCANCEYDLIFNQYWCGGSEVISDGFCNYGEREDPLHGAMNPPEDDITDGKGEAK